MQVQFGGNRLGSGNKMTVNMHNYSRSTHNLSKSWRSSAAPGVLYPFCVYPALNGDTFDFNLEAMAKTLPTNGPLMGSFKLQLDMFLCPIRLYQGILHNNPINIGMQMKNIKLPSIEIATYYHNEQDQFKTSQINPSCLLKYLGISGLGQPVNNTTQISRQISALPVLMYYDIFKNYYANKQEENAYVITGDTSQGVTDFAKAYYEVFDSTGEFSTLESLKRTSLTIEYGEKSTLSIYAKNTENLKVGLINAEDTEAEYTYYTPEQLVNLGYADFSLIENGGKIFGFPNTDRWTLIINPEQSRRMAANDNYNEMKITDAEFYKKAESIKLESFTLENIDTMRQKILSLNSISDHLVLGEKEGQYSLAPYNTLTKTHDFGDGINEETNNTYNMNGLCVKTYQSDIFNNWINKEWIDGENGIAALTNVAIVNDALNLDALNLAQKVYNLFNRVATAGGTYQDWQGAVYSQQVVGHMETPIYCGGMSSEIVFEEITSSVKTEDNPLGTLAGRGKLIGKKGGNVVIKVNEPCYIMGIMSITPRIDYCEGNRWYMTDIKTMDDFHKPELDGIGFQNLIGEQMAWWDTLLASSTIALRSAVGKVPAWINYMTDYDEVYGDFAKSTDGKNFMVLARNYTAELNTEGLPRYRVKDFTTYIDPSKYNYAFADASLSAQNFWIQIMCNAVARRLMSAKIIPNL